MSLLRRATTVQPVRPDVCRPSSDRRRSGRDHDDSTRSRTRRQLAIRMEPALGRRTRTYNAQFTPPVTLHHTTMRSWLCRVMRCELSRPDRPTSAFSVGVRPAVAPAVPAPPDTLRRRTHLSGGRADSVHTSILDTTKRSCLCRVWCTGVNWTIALNVFKFSVDDSLELSEIQFTPPKRTRHRQDSFVVSGVVM